MNIPRYDIAFKGQRGRPVEEAHLEVDADSEGEYCRYEDVKKLLEELALYKQFYADIKSDIKKHEER